MSLSEDVVFTSPYEWTAQSGTLPSTVWVTLLKPVEETVASSSSRLPSEIESI